LRILSTKILNDDQLKSLQELGEVDMFDAVEVEIVNQDFNHEADIIIFSSFKGCQFGLELIGNKLNEYAYICVGDKSYQLLTDLGCKVIANLDYSSELTNHLEDIASKKIVYCCSDKRRDNIPSILEEDKAAWKEVQVYKSQASTQKLSKTYDLIMWYSPMGVLNYVDDSMKNAQHICVGKTTAKELQDILKNKEAISFPIKPSVNEMIEIAKQLPVN